MRIALINPRLDFPASKIQALEQLRVKAPRMESICRRWAGVAPGTGLLILAALTPDSCTVDFIDENLREIDFSQPYDLVGITSVTHQAPNVYHIAGRFRERGAMVVVGGIHATLMPEEAKMHADSVVVGEAENLWPAVVRDAERGRLQPFYRSAGPVDLTHSPLPRYDLLKPLQYLHVAVQTTRGCPHDCEYCVATSVYGRQYRFKKVEQVVREVVYIQEHVQATHIFFCDDNFLVNRSHVRTLLRELIPLKIRWSTQSDIGIGDDPELLNLMRKSGCHTVEIGLEALSKTTLRHIDKDGWKLRQRPKYADYVRCIQEHGIGVTANFMVGFDTDTVRVFDDIEEFVLGNHLMGAFISIVCPFPGSRLRRALEQEGRPVSDDWAEYNLGNITFVPKQMSAAALGEGLARLYERIYSEENCTKRNQYFADLAIHRRKMEAQSRQKSTSASPARPTEAGRAEAPAPCSPHSPEACETKDRSPADGCGAAPALRISRPGTPS